MHYWVDLTVGAGFIVAWLLTQFVVLPYVRLQLRRRESWGHRPQAEEIWMQDQDLLYVDAVGPTGVELMSYDPKAGTFYRWKDTWQEWEARLRARTLWYTGQRRPLGPR